MENQDIELRTEEIEVAEGHDMKDAEKQSVAATDTAADATSQAPARTGDKKNSEPMPKTKGGIDQCYVQQTFWNEESRPDRSIRNYDGRGS